MQLDDVADGLDRIAPVGSLGGRVDRAREYQDRAQYQPRRRHALQKAFHCLSHHPISKMGRSYKLRPAKYLAN